MTVIQLLSPQLSGPHHDGAGMMCSQNVEIVKILALIVGQEVHHVSRSAALGMSQATHTTKRQRVSNTQGCTAAY